MLVMGEMKQNKGFSSVIITKNNMAANIRAIYPGWLSTLGLWLWQWYTVAGMQILCSSKATKLHLYCPQSITQVQKQAWEKHARPVTRLGSSMTHVVISITGKYLSHVQS